MNVNEHYLHNSYRVTVDCVTSEQYGMDHDQINEKYIEARRIESGVKVYGYEGTFDFIPLTDDEMHLLDYKNERDKTSFYKNDQCHFISGKGGFYHPDLKCTFQYVHEIQRFETLFLNNQ